MMKTVYRRLHMNVSSIFRDENIFNILYITLKYQPWWSYFNCNDSLHHDDHILWLSLKSSMFTCFLQSTMDIMRSYPMNSAAGFFLFANFANIRYSIWNRLENSICTGLYDRLTFLCFLIDTKTLSILCLRKEVVKLILKLFWTHVTFICRTWRIHSTPQIHCNKIVWNNKPLKDLWKVAVNAMI